MGNDATDWQKHLSWRWALNDTPWRQIVLKIKVMRSNVLGVDVVRGFASLSDLARISRPDVYDEKANPTGTQRDLSPKHAREAYEYARTSSRGYWPEVLLSVREPDTVRYLEEHSVAGDASIGMLHIDDEAIRRSDRISISRLDGNHRLHLAGGEVEGVPPVERTVSFCLAMGLTPLDEIRLFRDIDNNQKSMDTSHLDKIDLRLSGEEAVKLRDPALYIANKLANDADSPIQGFVYQGGKRPPGTFIPLRSLHTAVEYMLSRQTRLTALGGPDVQVIVIKNYLHALRDWVPEAWERPKDYLLLRGAGLWGSFFLGADVTDRALAKQKYEARDMLSILQSGKKWDWSRNGDFQGLGGRGGAVKIDDKIIRELRDENSVSIKELVAEILKQSN
jgi:DGQHR domain-containing protein